MSVIRNLIREVHRRSLWQVTGIFLAASWGALQVIETITETAGLPDWTPSMALVLLIIGLPICLATAFVQEGLPGQQEESPGAGEEAGRSATRDAADDPTGDAPAPATVHGTDTADVENLAAGTGSLDRPNTRPSGTRRFLTWRNAMLGGAGAFALLGLTIVAYFVMWSTGIGPVGNLVAQGVISDGERVVLANFEDETGEDLGIVVTEALRVDLEQAEILDLADEAELAPTLARMQVAPGTPLTEALAEEVAIRDGIGAVLSGGVRTVGSGYLITATLTESETGRALAPFRVSAANADELISSIDKLSQDVREKSGESLRDIRRAEPLEQVTTASLEALRLYSSAIEIFATNQQARVVALLEEAVEVDPEFAMAWRALSSAYNNIQRFDLMTIAATEAFEHRDRLTERERYLTEAAYYNTVTNDLPRTLTSYQAVLQIDPQNPTALNNISNVYNAIGEFEAANASLRQAVEAPTVTATAYSNLVLSEISLGRYEGAAQVLRDWEATFPDSEYLPIARFHVALMNDATSQARAIAVERYEDPTLNPDARATGALWLAKMAYREGRLQDARDLVDEAGRLSGQVAPALAAIRYLFGGRFELGIGERVQARAYANQTIETGALPAMPIGFTDVTALVLALAGDPDRAEALIAEAEATRPDDVRGQVLRSRAMIRVARGDVDGLTDYVDELMLEEGCRTDYCWEQERSEVYMAIGDVERAIGVLEGMANRGFEIWPAIGATNVTALYLLGPLYEERGDAARAIAVYQQLIEMWEAGDPVIQARVTDFRGRIRRLEASGG